MFLEDEFLIQVVVSLKEIYLELLLLCSCAEWLLFIPALIILYSSLFYTLYYSN